MRLFRRPSPDEGARWVIAGLGNPGDRYAGTRHNVGAMALDRLVERSGARLKRHKSGCLIAEVGVARTRAVLARPTSYMNESGRPLGELMRWYKQDPERLAVLHDEMDIPFGAVRVKLGGGTAGHNGLGSIASHVGTGDFVRVRIGVSRPRRDAVEHVLSGFSAAERRELDDVLDRAADAVERVLEAGPEKAMTEFNVRAGR